MKQLHWLYVRLAALFLATAAGAPLALGQATDPDGAAWQDALQDGSLDALQGYLEVFPNGQHSEEAFRQIIEQSLQQETGAGPSSLGTDLY